MPTDVFIVGAGEADFRPVPGRTSLQLGAEACVAASSEWDLDLSSVDALITGYSLTDGHFMFADALAEYLGIQPSTCYTVNSGGATGCLLVRNAVLAIQSGACSSVLVVWADNRISRGSRSETVSKLAMSGHPAYEVPYRGTVASLYALYASRYLHEFGARPEDIAEVAVQFRRNAGRNPSALKRDPVTVADVVSSKSIAPPLHLLDCCLVSDFGGALLLSADPAQARHAAVRVAGTGEAHAHEHVSQADLLQSGCAPAAELALAQAGVTTADLDFAQLYDCFTITVLMEVEELGIAPPGQAAAAFRDGAFDLGGELPLNTNGGMLSAVNGGIHHVIEGVRQLQHRAEGRQVQGAATGLVHGLGGVMSSHCSLVLQSEGLGHR